MDNIEEKKNELINAIIESNEYKKYEEAKKLLEESEYLNHLIESTKTLQKELVKAEKKGNEELMKLKKDELERCNNELEENPIYINYKNSVDAVNNILLVVKQTLDNYFSKKVE